ncbi:hypothetical protein A3Q56_05447 [Intoshia linei]|uniref:Uncharacterized protein n=1 Tax=Intoshia linei TaxID=1819745 RepID=A0A177AZ67_9BILA|nr:hypothetical protein A3Q56_05447 [Intoshia linei]
MINAPLGGSNMALFEVFHGNKSSKKNKNYFYGKVHSKNVKKTEAIYSLMVNVRNVEYDQAIYMDRSRNVSMSDYRMFFSPREIIQYEKNKYIHEQIHNLMSKTDIRICCISATTISSTISFYDYDTKTTHYVSGDGRTTADSINICEDYIGKADVLKINVEDNTYEPLAISNQGNSHVKIKNFIRNKIESQN